MRPETPSKINRRQALAGATLTFGALWLYAKVAMPKAVPLAVLAAILLLLQAINWFGPVETAVTSGTSLLAFFAYALATLAAWWVYRSEGRKQAG